MSVEQLRQVKQDLNRATLASQVSSNPIYTEAMIAIRGELFDKFQNTKFKQNDERDEIWRKLQTIDWLESYLKEVMETGELASHTLSLLEKAKKAIKC